MPQQTNLNVAPYFDDFDANNDYYKVLFKPGYPVQARELTTLQSILQNQIEQFGTHIFKEGSVVIPGSIHYKNDLNAVILQNTFQGSSVEIFLPSLVGTKIKGEISGVTAVIQSYISIFSGIVDNTTLYVKYLGSDTANNSSELFLDGENLLVDGIVLPSIDRSENLSGTPQIGNIFATTVSQNCTSIGSAVLLESGIYFLRGNFVRVNSDTLYLDPYSNNPTCKVGFRIFEQLINSDQDESLSDNSQGFNNYAAPGADRLRISTFLDKIDIDSQDTLNFIELFEIRGGNLISTKTNSNYNILEQEFARRTFDESGNYYVKSPTISVKESLNDNKGNGGVFSEKSLTYNNNEPSKDLGTYVISPIKAYISGFEIETISSTFLDFNKTRETKTLENQSINYFTGPTFTLNRVYGSPIIGIGNTYTLSLRDSRVGIEQTLPAGEEIGLARVYDFALESGSYNISNQNLNEWDISLYDIQTYTTINLNEPITLNVPTHIKGRRSGATGYLRYDVSNSSELVIYNISGKFSLGERIIIDGIQNTRVTTNIKSSDIRDVKSLYGLVGTSYTFSADVVQNTYFNVGEVFITAESSGISTVTSPNIFFSDVATPGNLISFTGESFPAKTFAKVETVSDNTLTISGITTVIGICDGKLPISDINVRDFAFLATKLQSSSSNTLYTELPKLNVAKVDLSKSNLIIRKQFDVIILNNLTNFVVSNLDETFLPFDEERYVLVGEDGITESLSSDKFIFSNGSKTLQINGLIGNGNAKLIATLRKINVKSKLKIKNRIKSIIVDKSIYSSSGIGASTTNDGLLFGNYPYGTRVQDEEICLLNPDVTKIYGVFESNTTNNPQIPSIIINNLDGPTNKTGDLLIGEEVIGEKSQSIGILVEKNNDLKFSFVYLNSNRFIEGEKLRFKDSGINGIVSSVGSGDKNITSMFTLDSNQRDTIYDVSKIVRNSISKQPTKKLKIIYEYASFSSEDTGDIITSNSYDQFDYCEIGSIDQIKNTDLIDIRPRISPSLIGEGARSPFEFLSRNFNSLENTSQNILASDESILIDYSFYLPRIDKISISKDGIFQLSQGVSSEIPQEPLVSDDSLNIATITLPPYLCNIDEVKITINQHKRYRMSDIQKLENRIKNLEFYTTLSLLEVDTSNFLITDFNGLNRFKSGFFVDDFSTTKVQKKETIVKNSIDIQNSELRPTHHTTSIDLLLSTNSIIGLGTQSNSLLDARTDNDLIGSNVKRTGQLITLDYDEVEFINQPYSSQVQSVSPYSSNYFSGTIQLYPSSDVWIDQVRLQPKTISADGNYTTTLFQLSQQGFDPQTGFSPVTWNSWEDNWTGSTASSSTRDFISGRNIIRETLQTITKTGTSTRQGTRNVIKEEFENTSFGDQVLSSQVIPYLRSRNIEFITKRSKPFTQVYPFFDGIDVNKFVIPKLLEIEVINGIFQVGEIVIGVNSSQGITSNRIIFRVAQQNHKYGSYDSPSDVFTVSPYDRDITIPEVYSSTSTILNVDTYSLSNYSQGQFSGYIESGMILRGQTSGAEAIVGNVRLITDNIGVIIGSFFIPDPNIDVNPKFECGVKTFRLTSSSINSQIPGILTTSAEEEYFSEGKINTLQENIIVTRNARIDSQSTSESKTISQTGSPTVVSSAVIGTIPPPPPPPPIPTPQPPARQPYNGFAPGVLPNGQRAVVSQYQGGLTAGNSTRQVAMIHAPGINRALAAGYPKSEIQSWLNTTPGIQVDRNTLNRFGLKPGPNSIIR